jgi:hypothetical protein
MTQLYQPTLFDDLQRARRAIAAGRAPVESPEYMREVNALEQLCKSLRSDSKPDHSDNFEDFDESQNTATPSTVGLNLPSLEFSHSLLESARIPAKQVK